MMWIKINELNADNTLFAKGGFATNEPILLWRDDVGANTGRTNTVTILVGDGSNNNRIEGASGALNDNEWHHIAFIFNASDPVSGLRLFIDGVEDPNSNVSTASIASLENNANDLRIGLPSSGTNKELDGSVDEVLLYDRLITSREIRAAYHANRYKIDYNMTNVKNGVYNISAFANNFNGNVTQTQIRKINMVNVSNANLTVHSPNIKILVPTFLLANFTSDRILSNASYIIDSNFGNRVFMNTTDNLTWTSNITSLSYGYHNITFAFYGPCGVEEYYYHHFYYIYNENISLIKEVTNLNTNLYLVRLILENKMGINKSISITDFVPNNFMFGSPSPTYNFTNITLGDYNGTVYVWNTTLAPYEKRQINYSLSGLNNNYSINKLFSVGID